MLFHTGSAVFLADSPFYEWWYPLLRPWVHYIPTDPEDLLETIEFAQRHDEEMVRFGEDFKMSIVADISFPHYVAAYPYIVYLGPSHRC